MIYIPYIKNGAFLAGSSSPQSIPRSVLYEHCAINAEINQFSHSIFSVCQNWYSSHGNICRNMHCRGKWVSDKSKTKKTSMSKLLEHQKNYDVCINTHPYSLQKKNYLCFLGNAHLNCFCRSFLIHYKQHRIFKLRPNFGTFENILSKEFTKLCCAPSSGPILITYNQNYSNAFVNQLSYAI